MEELSIKSAETSRWDCVSLGEVMLRLDPGEGRIHTVRQFQAWRAGRIQRGPGAAPLFRHAHRYRHRIRG